MKACLCIHCNDHVYILNRSIQEKFLENSFHGESAVTLLEEQQPNPIRIQPSFLINNCKYPVSIVKRREESSLELVGTEENTAPIFPVSFMRYTFSSKKSFYFHGCEQDCLFVCVYPSVSNWDFTRLRRPFLHHLQVAKSIFPWKLCNPSWKKCFKTFHTVKWAINK